MKLISINIDDDSPASGKMTIKIGKGKSKTHNYKKLDRKNSVFFVDGK